MNPYIERVKQQIEEHPPDFGDGNSILTLLYEAYNQVNRMDNEQIRAAKVALDRNTRLLLTGLEDKSDYEISKLIHDRLAAFMSYQSSENDQTIYGALVEQEAVCAGYASAYQYLMQKLGYQCVRVIGYVGDEHHAWCMAKLDGEWYHIDPTWGDQTGTTNFYYFAMTEETSMARFR
jgi:hypothetical protein